MANVPGDRLAAVRLEQLVDVRGVDPDHDQRLIKRNGISQHLEDRTVKADERQTHRALACERPRAQALRAAPASVRPAAGRPALGSRLMKQSTASASARAVSSPFMRSTSPRMPRGSARINGKHGRIPRGDLLLGRRQPGDFRDQNLTISVVGALQPEVFPPVKQHIGRRVAAQHVAQTAKLAGVFLVKKDRLDIQPIQKLEAAKAVGQLDCTRVSSEPIGHSGNQIAVFCAGTWYLAPSNDFASGSSQRPFFRCRSCATFDASWPSEGPSVVPAGLNASLNSTASAESRTAVASERFIEVPIWGILHSPGRMSIRDERTNSFQAGSSRRIIAGCVFVRVRRILLLPAAKWLRAHAWTLWCDWVKGAGA